MKPLYIRGRDAWGEGHYNARRTKDGKVYRHEGLDIVPSGDLGVVRAFVAGEVSKIGLPYLPGLGEASDLRYVQITSSGRSRYRYFYCDPSGLVALGDGVEEGQVIGQVQGLQTIFPGITVHYHLEIMPRGSRHKIDPTPILEALGYELKISD